MSKIISKILSVFLSFILIFQQSGFAQIAAELNIAGHLTALHNSFIVDKFRPLHLRYLQYLPQDNSFKLYLDKGDQFRGQGIGKKEDGSIFLAPDSGKIEPSPFFSDQTKTLLNYFFIGLTLPNGSFWVNLRPDSPDNIIDDYLAKTDVGKIMLEADLQLKKDTALATSPETPEGREYWNRLYKKAEELFGYDNVTIPTLTRPWIVPDEIIIRETPNTPSAYIYKATLKVMLEQDYLRGTGYRGQRTATRHPEPRRGEGSNSLDSSPSASPQGQNDYSFKDPRSKALNEYSTQLIRELIIPKLTKDVNSSKRYAPLRQVYYSLILAQWFKARFKQPASLRGREAAEAISSRIDSHNLTNLISNEPWSKTTYFQAYQKSFKDGEYNIQEPVYTPTGQTIRSYFSGGMMLKVNVGNLGAISSGSSPMIAIVAKNPIPSMQNLIEITSVSPLEKKTEDILRLSDNPDIKGVWDRIVVEHLQLYKFARLLRELSGTEGGYVPFYEFPKDKLNYLMSLIDFKSLEPYALKYHLGFITMNGWPYGRNGEDTFLFNFMLLVAIVKCGIPIEKVLISTNKFSLYYMLSNFKQHHRFISDSIDQMTIYSEITSEIKSGGFTLKKEEKSTLIKIIDDLIFNLLPSERISFDEYAEFKYKGGPIPAQIKILDEYKSKFDPELFVHPRQYIEGQEIIAQDSQAKSKIFWTNINERLGPTVPLEEIGKIRKIKLADGQEVFAKRINPLRVRTPEEEIEIAERVDKALQNINKHFHAQKFIGIIYDKGVFYLLSLAITYQRSIFKEIYGVDYNKFLLTGGGDQIKEIPVEVTEIQDIVEREGITDIRGWAGLKDILIAGAGDDVDYYVLDFETHPYDTPTAGSPAQKESASSAMEVKKEASLNPANRDNSLASSSLDATVVVQNRKYQNKNPVIFDTIDSLKLWVKNNLSDNEEIVLFPFWTMTFPRALNKRDFLEILDDPEYKIRIPYRRIFWNQRKAALSTVTWQGKPHYAILLGEVGSAPSELKGQVTVRHFLNKPNSQEKLESIQRHGLFVVGGRAQFHTEFAGYPGDTAVVLSLSSEHLGSVAQNPDLVGVVMRPEFMGAQLPDDLRRELQQRVKFPLKYRDAEQAQVLLLAEEAGFLTHLLFKQQSLSSTLLSSSVKKKEDDSNLSGSASGSPAQDQTASSVVEEKKPATNSLGEPEESLIVGGLRRVPITYYTDQSLHTNISEGVFKYFIDGYIKRKAIDLLDLTKGKDIVLLGGTLEEAKEVENRCPLVNKFHIVNIDTDKIKKMARDAYSNFGSKIASGRYAFYNKDICDLKGVIPDGSVALAVNIGTISFLDIEEAKEDIKEIERILAPGGIGIVEDMIPLRWNEGSRDLRKYLPESVTLIAGGTRDVFLFQKNTDTVSGSSLYSTQGLGRGIQSRVNAPSSEFQTLGQKSGSPIDKTGGIDTSTRQANNVQASLSVNPPINKEIGGIDFRALSIVTQAVSNLRNNLGDTFRQGSKESLKRKVSPTAGVDSRLRENDTERLDKELQEIEKLIEAGITPSAERIKEYLASSCLKEEKSDSHKERDSHFSSDMQKVVSCIAGILRLEEDRCYPTEPTLRDLLVVLEAGMPNQELRAIFSGVY